MNLQACWYSNDSYLANTTLSNCANITEVTWAVGPHNVTIWVNDSVGNENRTSVTFNVTDNINPGINITFPLHNNTNHTDTGIQMLTLLEVILTYKLVGYSNDTYLVNTTISSCNNITGVTWSQG